MKQIAGCVADHLHVWSNSDFAERWNTMSIAASGSPPPHASMSVLFVENSHLPDPLSGSMYGWVYCGSEKNHLKGQQPQAGSDLSAASWMGGPLSTVPAKERGMPCSQCDLIRLLVHRSDGMFRFGSNLFRSSFAFLFTPSQLAEKPRLSHLCTRTGAGPSQQAISFSLMRRGTSHFRFKSYSRSLSLFFFFNESRDGEINGVERDCSSVHSHQTQSLV